MTVHDILDNFVDAMRQAGMPPAEPIGQQLLAGDMVRFQIEGDRASRENGWAVLHLDDRPAGAFGCHKRQIKETWKVDRPSVTFSKAERAAYAKEMAEKRRVKAEEKDAAEREAAAKARDLLGKACPEPGGHPYLQKKRIGSKGFYQLWDSLVIPLRDASGDLWNLQFIKPDGAKRFLTNGRVSGLFWSIHADFDCVLVGEGVATMAVLHRATGKTCYASFSAANLVAVAETVRVIHPDADIVICADDDTHLVDHPSVGRNIGLDAAKAAAAAIGARIALPPRSTQQ